jgi:hypothetical protein
MALLRNLVLSAGAFEAVLLQITDWSLYSPDEMAVVMQLRKPSRILLESPGHVFGMGERDLLIGMMGLVAAYGWTAYVYFDERLTLLLWEGEIMDAWCPDSWSHQEIIEHVKKLQSEAESLRCGNG